MSHVMVCVITPKEWMCVGAKQRVKQCTCRGKRGERHAQSSEWRCQSARAVACAGACVQSALPVGAWCIESVCLWVCSVLPAVQLHTVVPHACQQTGVIHNTPAVAGTGKTNTPCGGNLSTHGVTQPVGS